MYNARFIDLDTQVRTQKRGRDFRSMYSDIMHDSAYMYWISVYLAPTAVAWNFADAR